MVNLNIFSYLKRMERDAESETLENNVITLENIVIIFITNPIIILKLLRNFGHLIRNLGIDFGFLNAKLCAEIENYLAEYCSESLQRFSLVGNTLKIPFEHLKKPLRKVTVLIIYMVVDQKQNHIQFLIESNLPNVQYIKLYNGTALQDSEKDIHYENLESFMFHNHGMRKFPFSFGNLKHFILTGNIILNDAFCECISNIKHLKTLKIMDISIFSSDSFEKLLSLQNILSNVVEMQFEFEKNMSTEVVLCFLKQSRNVRKLSFHIHKLYDYRRMLSQMMKTMLSNLSNEWKVYIMDP